MRVRANFHCDIQEIEIKNTFVRTICRILIVCMGALPFSAYAGMVATDQITAAAQAASAREKVRSFLERSEVRSQLQSLGVSPAAAAAALERSGHIAAARLSYAALLRRWPTDLVGMMGMGNIAYAMDHVAQAEAAFRKATVAHPLAAAAFNNLAQTLADQGKLDAAPDAARKAVSLGGASLPTAQATLKEILNKRR